MVIAFLLLWVTMALNLIPLYESGWDYSCTDNVDKTTPLTAGFNDIPTVIIWNAWEDHSSGTTKFRVKLKPGTVSKTSFTYTCYKDINAGTMQVAWFAYLDENIHSVSNEISNPPSPLIITFPIPQTTIPAAAFVISGRGITTSNNYMDYEITVDPPTLTGVSVDLLPGTGFSIDYIAYTVIYGSTDFFTAGSMIGTQTCICFLPQPKFTNFPYRDYQVISTKGNTLTRAYAMQSSSDCASPVFCPAGQISVVTWSPATISSWSLTYFQYSPCPYYCASCSTSAYPNCDSCKPITFRTSSNCAQCLSGYYLLSGQYIYGSCLSYCQGCSGSASSCTACNPATQRLSSPACTTCPPSYFVQTGFDNCQCKKIFQLECASYCQTCVSSNVKCTACLSGSNRILAGYCMTCPISMYIQVGLDNCQVCKTYCNGCSNAASTCLACQSSSLRLNAPNCTTCPVQMFIQSGLDTCQTCSTICNNCSITSTNCTSCLASTQRLYPPNCQTCPNNMFIQIGQDNCQQCNSLCNQCTVSANNCTACNGLYRTNAPNCNQCSQPNYYIDSSFIDCQPCASYCNGCVTSSTNCLACWPFTFQQFAAPYCEFCPTTQFILNPPLCNANLSNLICSSNYNRDTNCNCLSGYYNTQNSLNCLKCSNICQTCTGSATNCTICNSITLSSLPPTCNNCLDGYYRLNGICNSCSNICQTCTQSNFNCIACPSPRINPPQCQCPNGYFNNCSQSCSSKCLTCTGTSDNCLVCSGNRTNPPICGCSDGSVQSSAICSNCSIASPTARFSDDLNQILIIFEFKLNFGVNCDGLLSQQTFIAMGTNYNCLIDQNVLILNLGTQASISVFQPIFIKSNQLQFYFCNTTIDNIITPMIQMPQNLQPPQIQFESSQIITTQCDAVFINIIGFLNSGQRNLELQKWSIIQARNYQNMKKLIDKWNSEPLFKYYTIDSQYLNSETQITLMIQFQNFIGQQSNQTLQITIQTQTLQLKTFVPKQFYIFDTAQFIFTPLLYQCGQNLQNQLVSLSIIFTNSTKTTLYNYTVGTETQTIISFDPYELSLYSTYYIQASATLDQLRISIEKNFTIVPFIFTVNILGGDQQIGINQQLNLSLEIFDPNIQKQDLNITQYTITWQCINVVTNQQCTGFSYIKQNAVVNTSNYQPYTTLQIEASVQKNSMVVNSIISALILQDLINQIKIQGNQYQLNSPTNFYDQVDVSIYFLQKISFDVDQLTYQAMYLDSTYQQNIIDFKSIQTAIEVNNFERSQLTTTAKYKVMIKHPMQSYPSVATHTIKINIPPQYCQLSIQTRGVQYFLQINNCVSQQQPLQYQFIYYQSKEDLLYDNETGIITKGLLLTNYQIQPTFVTYLMGSKSMWILGIIRDQQNGLANVSINLQDTQFIDQPQLKKMLQGNSINLPRNIFFILQYAQTNNQTITRTYLNQINQLVNQFKQSDPMTLQIQQKIVSQQKMANNEIINQLDIQKNEINSISIQLNELQTLQQNGEYNKNYSIRLLSLEVQLLASTNHISFLYEQSQQTENRRILMEQVQNITSYVTSIVQNITDIIGNLTKINQKQKTIETPQFNLSAQKFSTSNINQNFGIQIINQSNQTVSFKNQKYSVNPYQNESNFANAVKAPLIIPNLTDVNSIQIKPANPIPISFPLIGNISISCASKLGNSWNLDVCTPVKSSTTIECLCQTLSPLSIVQALEYILSQFAQLFARTIKDKISNFPYYNVIYTYLVIVFIISFIATKFVLHRLDALDASRVHPQADVQNSPNNELRPGEDSKTYKVQTITSARDLVIAEPLYTQTSLIGNILNQAITKQRGFLRFLQNTHILLELYYRYDEQEPRILRLNILFLQMLGQICIFVLFGKNLAISIVIGLSIFQTAYGIIFQLILSKMIKAKNKYISISGLLFAVCLTGFCTYLIIASMSLYSDVYSANIAALSYLASFVLDYFISTILVELGKYIFILKTCKSVKYKVQIDFKQKIYEILLSPGLQEIIFGKKLQEPKTYTKI